MDVNVYTFVVKIIFDKVGRDKWSGVRVYHWLKEEIKFTTRSGKSLNISTLYELLKNPFYCGVFEYPRKSGNWYVGKHEALITRELFEEVRKKVIEDTKPRKRFGEFAFVRMMTCGECGSGITALEKEKIIKGTGESKIYRYYVCSRAHDRRCKNPYIREDALLEQLGGIIDEIEIDRLGARTLIDKEIARFNNMQSKVLGMKGKEKARDVDIKRYAKYLLEEGSIDEKRQLLEQLRGKLVMQGKKISLVP